MKTFKEFLSEETLRIKSWDEKDVGEEQAIKEINAHCHDALKAFSTGAFLFRGLESELKFRKVDSSTGTRTSRDTNNIYQLLFDSSSDFSGYPKRSKSMICTNDLHVAKIYGKPHLVLPYDGTKLAISSRHDFIRQKISAPILGTGNTILLMRLSKFIGHFLSKLGIKSEHESTDDRGNPQQKFVSIDEIDSALSKFDPIVLTMLWDRVLEDLFTYSLITYDSIPDDIKIDMYEAAHSLKANDRVKNYIAKEGFPSVESRVLYKLFTDNSQKRMTAIASYLFTKKRVPVDLKNYSEYVNEFGVSNEREIWFSGPAMLVGKAEAKRLVDALRAQGEIVDHRIEEFIEK